MVRRWSHPLAPTSWSSLSWMKPAPERGSHSRRQGQTRLIDVAFRIHRHAVQWGQGIGTVAGAGRIGCVCRRTCIVFEDAHDRIDRRIDLVQARKHRVHRLTC